MLFFAPKIRIIDWRMVDKKQQLYISKNGQSQSLKNAARLCFNRTQPMYSFRKMTLFGLLKVFFKEGV
ncbi:hypothetical protein C3K47_09460 [Solitalea longa]|uniref:Uncharacterized protein n=1 Tax=Solitalea longa TaxID=2079460 RepID=A0A2S5A2T3_9SPHI|nr:hypothetical protein C3K47_09460 [Solitalea longa]